jgi:serine/threonine protein kinase
LTPTVCPECATEYSGGEVFCPNDGVRLVAKERASQGAGGRAAVSDPLIGQLLGGRYRILRKIGEGGMGIVYEAEHVVIEKRVGLKVLREDFSSRPDVVERFRQEAKSASRIGHEHIIDISDFGETPTGACFFVMELLQGHDLAEELSRKGRLSPRRTVNLALQCARALGAAHAKGIVHRDMKPENIFLVTRDTGEDFIKIVDFGIAKMSDIETDGEPGRKLTKTGMIFGTPEYMSPEQASGKKLDHRVDIYALGVIMYELLTGRVPFMADTFMGVLTQHVFEAPPPLRSMYPQLAVPPELELIVYKALAKDPDERFQSMEEMAAALAQVLALAPDAPLSAPPPPGTVTHPGQLPGPLSAPAPRLPAPSPAAAFSAKPGTSSVRFAVWGAGLVLLSGAVAGLWLLRERSEQSGASAQEASFVPSLPPPAGPAANPQEALATQAPAAAPEPASSRVLVHVHTEPKGAVVSVDGETACEPTPCSFSTRRDELVRLAVQKPGFRSASTEIKASADDTKVELTLARRAPVPARSAPRPEDELKVPDAFAPSRRR